ncbi:DNA polymerase alpha subunit B [Impatiens glandulifera]|uniref:DNA polymerase alpha subunit B n=1 Tax=Impatiens glandulifera TaxID=253017 RepID=UPI001FB1788C|nr:DNA polymerase alpha subunit B [Impatiens glandulifera]
MDNEIREEFKKSGFILEDEQEILNKCLTFCIQYKLSASDIVSRWDAFSMTRQLEQTVQDTHMDAFMVYLQNEQKEAIIKQEPGLHISSKDVEMILNDNNEDTEEVMYGTPTKGSETVHMEPFDSAYKTKGDTFPSGRHRESMTPFGQRKTKFVLQIDRNDLTNIEDSQKECNDEFSDDDIIKKVQPSTRCSMIVEDMHPEPGCRYMYDKIEDKFNFLESRIRKHAMALVASGLHEDPTDPTVASQRSIFAVGMICCDEEGRLKEKPILLQSSVENSGGQRVRVDLQKLSQFSIFPGQVVGIEGNNPSGHCLIASRIIDCIPLSLSADENPNHPKKQAVEQELNTKNGTHVSWELSMIIAAGPFTTVDNLLFEPLSELLAYARRKQPQLLILLGPFIDSEHPEIKKGTVNRTFEELFHFEFLVKLRDYVEYMGPAARVVLVPSIRDANHDFVFPQPAFDIQSSDLKHQITSIPNPGTFIANEVRISCCSVDILKELSQEEISRIPPKEAKQRITRLANHILSQRSLYPLYPPAEGTPLDFSLAPDALQISSIPDILILPSDLTNFVKVISVGGGEKSDGKCICVNPGRLAKGECGGSFVHIHYHSHSSSTASIIKI